MATPTTRSTAAKRAAKGAVLPEGHTASEAVAHAVGTQYNDLTPSVNRIMNSGLGETGKLHAITLFRDSLGVAGDPYRNPINAIEQGRLVDDSPAE